MPTPPRAPDGPRALLLVISGNLLVDALEMFVVLIALPSVGRDLGLGGPALRWILAGFPAGFAALLPLSNRVTARWGRRRVYLAAMAGFATASLAAGLAHSAALLVLTQVVKGACAALTTPAGLAILSTTWPDGPARTRALGVYSAFGAAGSSGGLLLSGALTPLDWRWTLLFPVPVVLLLLWQAVRVLPPDPAGEVAAAPRVLGRVLPPDPAAGATAAPPVTPGRMLRNGPLVRAALGAMCLNGAFLGLLLLIDAELQQRAGWSPWSTALVCLPACLPLAVSPLLRPLLARIPGTGRRITLGAFTALAGQLAVLLAPATGTRLPQLLAATALSGVAFVLSFAALNEQAFATVPPAERPAVTPLYQTAVQLSSVVMIIATTGPLATAASTTAVAAAGAAVSLSGPAARRTPSPSAAHPSTSSKDIR